MSDRWEDPNYYLNEFRNDRAKAEQEDAQSKYNLNNFLSQDQSEVDKLLSNLGISPNMSVGKSTPINMSLASMVPVQEQPKQAESRISGPTPQPRTSSEFKIPEALKISEEISDIDELREARNTSALLDFLGGTQRAFEKISAGMANVRPDQQAGASTIASGEEIVKQAKENMALREAEKERKQKEALSDPNSPIAKYYKSMLMKDYSRYIDSDVQAELPKLNAIQAKEILDQARERYKLEQDAEIRKIARLESQTARDALLEEKRLNREQRAAENLERDKTSAQDSLMKSTNYKSSEEMLSAMQEVRPLIELAGKEGGPSYNALGTRLAKAMGERGVLTDQDVIRYLRNEGIFNKVFQAGQREFTGELDKNTAKKLINMVDRLEKIALDRREKTINQYAEKFRKTRGEEAGRKMSKEEAKDILDPGNIYQQTSSSDWKPVILKDGRKGWYNKSLGKFTQDQNEIK